MKYTPSNDNSIGMWAGIAAVVGLFVLLGWLGSVSAMVLAIVITLVLVVHELGHFVTARLTGMKATEFYVGFGPRLWFKRFGETDFGMRVLPLGAYVRVIGMSSLDKVDPADEHRTYRSKSFPRRALVISAGSLMHFIMAFLALVALHGLVGQPEASSTANWEVASAPPTHVDGTAAGAHLAGISPGDRIYSLNGTDVFVWTDFVEAVRSRPGQTVDLTVLRSGAVLDKDLPEIIPVTIGINPDTGEGRIGIAARGAIDYSTAALPVAAWRAVLEFGDITWQTFRGVGLVFGNIGELTDRIISPPNDPSANENLETRPLSVVGLVQVGSSDTFNNADRLFMFAAFNIFIGIFNMFPLPPLDGGHLAIAAYERWRERGGRPRHMVDMKRLVPVFVAVTVLLALIGVGVLYLDIANPVNLGGAG